MKRMEHYTVIARAATCAKALLAGERCPRDNQAADLGASKPHFTSGEAWQKRRPETNLFSLLPLERILAMD